ncbi:reverse transcriptase/maturase family protein [Acetomicrobium sp. S15 = DSM 107314]|uniref:reverse transcriptase/maturase family protein n=1 Tax=Acetomicrobium sp. S15 = DSM 107314 TaxID=2529858 RepID=UPI0018E0E39A|nr:reverse transcriptase/maturase family protein [Acetomicrobium sp. S15 = DSM 107314]
MKKLKQLYPKIYAFENLLGAYVNARKCKRFRNEVMAFTDNLEENLICIQEDLMQKTYRVGKYKEFFVYDPKMRLIMALPFRDRVVQWAIYRVLNPLLDKRYIYDSYACRIGYGIHRATDRLQYWLRYLSRKHKRVYALKLDISKYFYRIDHDVLMEILSRIIADKDLLWLLERIIRSENTKFGISLGDHCFNNERLSKIGMPIGNLTSQMFANLYLNELDQYAKHELKTQYYIRYMDDIIILHPDKIHLQYIKTKIDLFINNQLHLSLNNKTSIHIVNQGIDFCGYRVWATHKKLRKKTALKMKRRLKALQRAYAQWRINFTEVNASVQSYFGLLKHCDSYNLRVKLCSDMVFRRENNE